MSGQHQTADTHGVRETEASTGRYSRQELFTPIGKTGQRRLSKKHVLIIGAGALGSANAENLVRAGIGRLTLIDRDYVDWSNLQRQQLYEEEDAKARLPKAVAAAQRLKAINSEVEITAHTLDAGVAELEELAGRDVDLIIDAADNFDVRMIINDVSQQTGIPWIYGACVGSYGLSYTILPGRTPCLNCLMESIPMGGVTCDTVGVIQPAVQMVVAHQTAEALKLLAGDEGALRTKLVSFDLWKNQYSAIDVSSLRKSTCPSCGEQRTYPHLSYENQTKAAVLCGRDTVQIRPAQRETRELEQIGQRLTSQGLRVERNPFLLSFSVERKRLVLFQDGRVFVHGCNDISEARTLYHRYLG
ncbi:thiazole biosynthesis adenylyltransferase ThiF [Paenibacillus sp. DYY-L-2]|uniref:thiazole biosynthesis adenylyltransferase ThiF n=1 Tax=Paenibacillus sp. DYY-L-2 TaxID=3447013 RepID=UPI003F4FF37C